MSETGVVQKLSLANISQLASFFGELDSNLNWLQQSHGLHITLREEQLVLRGPAAIVEKVAALLSAYDQKVGEGFRPTSDDLRIALQIELQEKNGDSEKSQKTESREALSGRMSLHFERKSVAPKGPGQQIYLKAIESSALTFGIGPAGTGKTYLAMACAVDALLKRKVKRIVLTRPAVEAGESLGFLPGSLQEKVSPYLRPLYDALYDLMDMDKANKLLEKGIVEVAPLAFMRGRTLSDAFVILDEAQNTTADQMKMFLTRLGIASKAVVTGDITQIDLPYGKTSGLISARSVLSGIPEIAFVHLTEQDIVRHPLVRVIIEAYQRAEEKSRAFG